MHRRQQHDDGDRGEAHDRARGARGDVQAVPDVAGVGGAAAHDLAQVDPFGERPAEPGALAREQLLDPEGAGHPVRDGPAVTQDAGARLHDADAEQDSRPEHERCGVVRCDAPVDAAADDERDGGLAAHPDDAERHAPDQGGLLASGDPDQEAQRGAEFGITGVGQREGTHVRPR